jgi:multiple sugar transport system permease protein
VRSNIGLVFALPALIVLFMLIAYPVTYTGWLSLTNDQGQFTGLQNFSDVLRPRVTTQALFR